MAHFKARKPTPTPHYQPTWEMRAATEADMRWIAPRLIQSSLDEIEAVSKFAPISVLLRDMDRKGVIVDKSNPTQPVAVFDISPIQGQQAAAYWSAMTAKVVASDWFWTFTDHAGGILNQMHRLHPSLSTYVDARNAQQIAWLERVGFVHVEDVPQFGRKELPFKLYRRVASSNV